MTLELVRVNAEVDVCSSIIIQHLKLCPKFALYVDHSK